MDVQTYMTFCAFAVPAPHLAKLFNDFHWLILTTFSFIITFISFK